MKMFLMFVINIKVYREHIEMRMEEIIFRKKLDPIVSYDFSMFTNSLVFEALLFARLLANY